MRWRETGEQVTGEQVKECNPVARSRSNDPLLRRIALPFT
jgi:hypothetical protein